jgi:seryl-tRNA(Sec) selenium transferase
MQGDEMKAAEDLAEVGKSLGVVVMVDQANRFNVLSRAGKGKQPTPVGSSER